MPGLTWEALDAKLREGVQEEVDAQQQIAIHRMLERALVKVPNPDPSSNPNPDPNPNPTLTLTQTRTLTKVLPASMELPESIIDEVTKERFAATLADQRQVRGSVRARARVS